MFAHRWHCFALKVRLVFLTMCLITFRAHRWLTLATFMLSIAECTLMMLAGLFPFGKLCWWPIEPSDRASEGWFLRCAITRSLILLHHLIKLLEIVALFLIILYVRCDVILWSWCVGLEHLRAHLKRALRPVGHKRGYNRLIGKRRAHRMHRVELLVRHSHDLGIFTEHGLHGVHLALIITILLKIIGSFWSITGWMIGETFARLCRHTSRVFSMLEKWHETSAFVGNLLRYLHPVAHWLIKTVVTVLLRRCNCAAHTSVHGFYLTTLRLLLNVDGPSTFRATNGRARYFVPHLINLALLLTLSSDWFVSSPYQWVRLVELLFPYAKQVGILPTTINIEIDLLKLLEAFWTHLFSRKFRCLLRHLLVYRLRYVGCLELDVVGRCLVILLELPVALFWVLVSWVDHLSRAITNALESLFTFSRAKLGRIKARRNLNIDWSTINHSLAIVIKLWVCPICLTFVCMSLNRQVFSIVSACLLVLTLD